MPEVHDDGRDTQPNLAADDKRTGLAWPRSWPALYASVVIVFTIWVAILYALTRKFS